MSLLATLSTLGSVETKSTVFTTISLDPSWMPGVWLFNTYLMKK